MKNSLQLTLSMRQIETYYAVKLRRAGEHMAHSVIPGRINVCVVSSAVDSVSPSVKD